MVRAKLGRTVNLEMLYPKVLEYQKLKKFIYHLIQLLSLTN